MRKKAGELKKKSNFGSKIIISIASTRRVHASAALAKSNALALSFNVVANSSFPRLFTCGSLRHKEASSHAQISYGRKAAS